MKKYDWKNEYNPIRRTAKRPVSYTHLDVYKRQFVQRTLQRECSFPSAVYRRESR